MARRRNTVHDLSALQLHPDGSRVGLTDRQSRYLARDARGNRIAADAGGSGTVKKRKRAQSEDQADEQQEEINIDLSPSVEEPQSAHDSDHEAPSLKGKGKGKEKDPRTKKRLRHQQEYEFPGSSARHPMARVIEMPPPSSDLLKCIYHQATTYYFERGELLNATKHARQEKTRRRLKKAQKNGTEANNGDEGAETDEESDDSAESSNVSMAGSVSSKEANAQSTSSELVRDMYKMFDGSALMALGILFHQNLGELLEPMLAAEWERSMHENQVGQLLQDLDGGKLVFKKREQKNSSQKDLESDDAHEEDSDFSPALDTVD